MFHRLQIISLEDIGPSLLPYIETIDKLLNELKDVTNDERKAFSAGLQFINICCQTVKTRSCSWYKSYFLSSDAAKKYGNNILTQKQNGKYKDDVNIGDIQESQCYSFNNT
jgi:hypothetical protein